MSCTSRQKCEKSPKEPQRHGCIHELCTSRCRKEFVSNRFNLSPLVVEHRIYFFPECVAKGSRLTLGGLGVESCSRSVVSMFATVRNRSQPSATVRSRTLRRCHWGKLLQVTFHGCVTCQFATLFHCDLHENDMSRKKRDAFRCTGAVV